MRRRHLSLTAVLLALISLVFLTSLSGSSSASREVVRSAAAQPVDSGVDFPSWTTDGFSSSFAFAGLRRLAHDHVRWVTFVPTWYQAHGDSNHIAPQPGQSASDSSLTP